MKFSIKDFFSQLKKSLMENFIFCAALKHFNNSLNIVVILDRISEVVSSKCAQFPLKFTE